MSSGTVPQIHELTKQIEERIKAARPAHLLYNPSDEWVEILVNGSPISIPPDGRVLEHGEWKTYDGTIAVRDQYGMDPEEIKKARQRGIKRPNLPANKVVLSALDQVSHAIRKRHLRGITFLTGNPVDDAPTKAQAKRTWIEWRKEQAEKSISAYRTQTAAFHADSRNQGQPAPPMPDHVQAAQEFLDEYRLGTFNRKQHACPVNCGYYTDDAAKLATHVAASHPLSRPQHVDVPAQAYLAPQPPAPLAPAAIEAAEPEPDPEPGEPADGSQPRRGPGRPRKVPYHVP
jgi:hypothetical protein